MGESVLCQPGTDLRGFGSGLDLYMRGGRTMDLAALALRPDMHPQRSPMLKTAAGCASPWLHSTDVELGDDPYPYLIAAQAMRPLAADHLMEFLRDGARWCLNDGGFYAAMECDLLAEAMPNALAELVSPDALEAVSAQASTIFGERLQLTGAIAGHRLDAGHGIGLHSDRPRPGEETHRLLITLAESPSERCGGHFLMFSTHEPETLRRVVPLRHNMAIAFALTERSYHAVTVMRAGCRFSIVFSFSAPVAAATTP